MTFEEAMDKIQRLNDERIELLEQINALQETIDELENTIVELCQRDF